MYAQKQVINTQPEHLLSDMLVIGKGWLRLQLPMISH